MYMLYRILTVLHMTIARLVFKKNLNLKREILMVAKCELTASLYSVV